jgi:hypothetical protein
MKNLVILCLAVLVCFGAIACNNEVRQQKVLVADDYIKQKPRYLKPGADIRLVNSQVNLAVAGVQYAVDIKVDSGYVNGDMALSVSASDGLYIVGGDINATKVLVEGVVNNVYQVMATEAGRYYIYVNVNVQSGGQVSNRSLTFIVQVGEEDKDATAETLQKVSPAAGGVISMPAKEEVLP